MVKKTKTWNAESFGGKKIWCKIFVSVGTHPQQFDRLLAELDLIADFEKIKGDLFVQSGFSTYVPSNYKHKDFLTLEEFQKNLKECDIFITHAGEGNIGQAKNLGKKMIVIPRRKEFSEHTNDHQLELAHIVKDKKMGLVAWNPDELSEKLDAIEKFTPAEVPRGNISKLLDNFVKKEF